MLIHACFVPLTRLSNNSTTIVYRKGRFWKQVLILNEYEFVWLIYFRNRVESQGFNLDFMNCTMTFSSSQVAKKECKTFYNYKIMLILPL